MSSYEEFELPQGSGPVAPLVIVLMAIKLFGVLGRPKALSWLLAAGVLVAVAARVDATLDVWATEEKVWREELRPASFRASTLWNGEQVRLSAARNEVVSFALVLEARSQPASNVSVHFPGLPGLRVRPPGQPVSDGSELFDWRRVEVELFYIRYLEILGMGRDYSYDERILPPRMQRPWTPGHQGAGVGEGAWGDRPGANKHWPEIAVPLELHPQFDISANESQMIWVDIYVPKGACAGLRRGNLTVSATLPDGSSESVEVAVALQVRRFELPDEPTAKTMVPYEGSDILRRYTGQNWVHCTLQHTTRALFDRHFQLAWRHKIAMVDGSIEPCIAEESPKRDEPQPFQVDRLNGKAFSYEQNYTGPGQDTGVGIFSVGLYGSWRRYWESEGEAGVRMHADRWRSWFARQSAPLNDTEVFLYLVDESTNYSETEMWASWARGSGLRSMATLHLPEAVEHVPSLDIACSTMGFASTSRWENATTVSRERGRPELWMYNGGRPAAGGFSIEEEASAPRSIPWAMYKKNVTRYFYWMATYYTNYQAGEGAVDVFNQAKTFGRTDMVDEQKGETGWMYGNGDGVLMYPGTDKAFPERSYNISGPIAGLRLKYWRRGLQDVEYLELLRKHKGEAAVREMLDRLVPKVLWEVDVPDPNDATWARTNTSWPEEWDAWEQVRLEIADAIEAQAPTEEACTPTPPEPEEPPAPPPCHPTGGALEWPAPGGGGGAVRVWATEEKVLREEHWADCGAGKTRSSLWNGSAVTLFGARNEAVSFALVLEASSTGGDLREVGVELPSIGGLKSRSVPTDEEMNDSLFDWRDTQIELFYVRYLQIKGLSGTKDDERLHPKRMQRPWMAAAGGGGLSSGLWTDRPGANKHYPEIAVPIELHRMFNISAGESQMVWVDVYIPRDSPAGTMSGDIIVRLGDVEHAVPVSLRVLDFSLPDKTSSRTMVPIEGGDVLRRFIGQNWVHCTLQNSEEYRRLWERHWQLAWRHRVSLVGGSFDGCADFFHYMGDIEGDLEVLKDQPEDLSIERMNGSSFTRARNYSGPGENLSLDIFSLGLYGSWSMRDWDKLPNGTEIGLQEGFEVHLNRWEEWFRAAPPEVASTDRFFYLVDESSDYAQTEEWAAMCDNIEGPGAEIPTMATLSLPHAVEQTPSLDIACSTLGFADTEAWEEAVKRAKDLDMEVWLYNGGRPAHGTTNTEGEATDWRTIPWAMRKHNISMYFYWMSTYYTNYQAGEGPVNIFQQAKTFGDHGENSTTNGEKGWMYGNGDGVLLYPGTDKAFPEDDYNVWGPFVSLRMKYWRRGLQDVEYLELFRQRFGDLAAQQVVDSVLPRALWEVHEANWFPEISWPEDWEPWEQLRLKLATAIETGVWEGRGPGPASPAPFCVRIEPEVLAKVAALGYHAVGCKR